MKAIIKKAAPKKAKPFPKLMISKTGQIVFMDKDGNGPVIAPGNMIGKQSIYGWAISQFKDFEGSVTLSND